MAAQGPLAGHGIKGVVVKTEQGWFCLDPDEQFVSKSLLETGAYGQGEIEQARQFCDDASRVLVVGAHIGSVAIPLARFCAELVAIEANPDTYEFLELNIAMNRGFNILAYNVAANDRRASIEFVMNTVNSGGSKRMPMYRDHIYFNDNPRVATVSGARLDDLLPGERFELVFMDIEGSEYHAFLGMQRILSGAKTLIVEFLPHHLSRVAGVTVEEFLQPLSAHFSTLTVPSTGQQAGKKEILGMLQHMFDNNQDDAGIIFQK